MAIPVLICDDSSLARKQMARSLPADWPVDVSFASDGQEALAAIRAGKADVLFLDLNMPVMNGYEVLDAIRAEDLPTLVMVVSGDVQAEAYAQVISKGALDFVRKPVSTEKIRDVLSRFGILDTPAEAAPGSAPWAGVADFDGPPSNFSEMTQEVVNVAMGQAGSLLAGLLGTFIRLPVPRVHDCHYADLQHCLSCAPKQSLTGVSHGFTGNGVAGEAMLLLDSAAFPKLSSLLNENVSGIRNEELGILTDLSGILIGACLQGMSSQLDMDWNHSYPVLLGRDENLPGLLGSATQPQRVVAVEITYELLDDVQCHLLIIFTADSVQALADRMELLQ